MRSDSLLKASKRLTRLLFTSCFRCSLPTNGVMNVSHHGHQLPVLFTFHANTVGCLFPSFLADPQKQKIAIREAFSSVSSKRESLRAEQRTIRDKTRNVNPEELEQKIAENEFKLAHESLSEQEDKRTQVYLQQLLAARPQARQFAAVEARLKDCEVERATVVKRLQDCDTVINSIVAQIDAERAALDEVSFATLHLNE